MKTTKIHTYLTVSSIFAFLTSCATSPDPIRFYSFNPDIVSSNAELKSNNISVGIRSITIPRLLDRPQIVTRVSSTEIIRAKFNQWGGDIREEIEEAVVKGLSFYLGTSKVFAFPKQNRINPDYELILNIHRLDGMLGKTVILEMGWYLESFHGPKRINADQVRLSRQSSDANYANYTDTINSLVIQATEEIAKEILEINDYKPTKLKN